MAAIYSKIGEHPPSKVPIRFYLREIAKNPDSIELMEVSEPVIATLDGQHYWKMRARYRGENSFGGMSVESGTAYIALITEHQQAVIFWVPD